MCVRPLLVIYSELRDKAHGKLRKRLNGPETKLDLKADSTLQIHFRALFPLWHLISRLQLLEGPESCQDPEAPKPRFTLQLPA